MRKGRRNRLRFYILSFKQKIVYSNSSLIGAKRFCFEKVTGLLKSAGAAAAANFQELAAPAFAFVG
jgi:hypothetical protein